MIDLSEDERWGLIDFLEADPKTGDEQLIRESLEKINKLASEEENGNLQDKTR